MCTMAASSSFLQRVFGGCTAPPIAPCGSDQHRSSKALVTHRFDRPMRCIIDPKEVIRMIKYQGDELKRQEQDKHNSDSFDTPPLHTDTDTRTEAEMWDVESSILGTEFSFATKTDITTDTGATPVLANRDRYSPPDESKKHRSKAEQFRVTSMESIGIGRPKFKTGTKQSVSMHMHTVYDDPTIAIASSMPDKNIRKKDLPPGVQLTGSGCAAIFAPCASDDQADLRKEYGRALHLKMKANMGAFYSGHFLKMFPNSPLTESADLSRTASFQSLNSSWTDNSLLNVNYGDHVHSAPIQMIVDDSDFMDFGITGSLGLVKRFEVNQSGQRLKSPNHYKVLINRRSGVPLAVCALKSIYGDPVVRIYTVKQRHFGQKPAATTEQLGLSWCEPYPLYIWAEFTAEGDFPFPVRYSLYMSSGFNCCFEQEPSYRAFHRMTGSPEIMVLGKTETEFDLEGCALISLQSNDENGDHFHISVSHGIDPALMVCLASIVDETMESTMRRQCNLTLHKQKMMAQGNGLLPIRRQREL
jgi:hypothetical protein